MNFPCPFCSIPDHRIVRASALTATIRDNFPIAEGHTLVIPRRHIASFFDLTEDETIELTRALIDAKAELDRLISPDGYNIGINDGEAAGQTIPHLHIHLIPRHQGDVADPRGGIRWLFPSKAAYWETNKI